MATTRAANPSGAKLLDESKAHPGSLDKSIFQQRQSSSSGAGQGTVNDNYLRECREDNPEPASQATEAKSQVQLSNCRILTPAVELRLNQDFEMAVDLKKLDSAAASTANFSLFATRTRDGKEERAKIWADKPGKADDDKSDPIVLKAKDVLATEDDYKLGEKVVFELEATHEGAEAPCKSAPVEIGLKCLAKWVGGDNLFFRNDGEFPLLKVDASLVEVLATAVEYVQQMKPGAEETAVCFGYASSVGAANSNRRLSLRRAQAIKAILDRDFETWEALAKVNFTTIDIQQFLSDLHKACGWECDPGAVDGQSDPQTKAAILAFQKECNSRYRYGLKEDGACGPKTWRGVLRTIHGLIQAEIGGDPATEPNWNKPKWGHSGKGVYANGEDAATGGDKPEERSVQITFFAPGSEPALVDAPDGDPTNPELNPILNAERYEKEKLRRQRENAERARQAEEERRRGAEAENVALSDPFADFKLLEDAAVSEGFSLRDRITAFRILYYPPTAEKREVFGVIVGGGGWDILVPGTSNFALPRAWSEDAALLAAVKRVKSNRVLLLNGQGVELGHVFAGVDAANHRVSPLVLAGVIKHRSNVEPATWSGDLGSVVATYIHNSPYSFYDTARVRKPLLDVYYDKDPVKQMASSGDMLGNVDSFFIDLNGKELVHQSLTSYYEPSSGGWKSRGVKFRAMIGALSKNTLQEDVFNAALTYAASQGWKEQLVLVFNDPGPGPRFGAPTFWEAYWNVSGWVVEGFLERNASL